MDNDFNFETYLHISPSKFVILVNSDQDENIYKKEMLLNDEYEKLDLEKLNFFLNENIFEIEKKLNNFVKKIFIILSSKEFFPVEISIKKNDFEKKIITSEFKSEDKYYYYSYLFDENNNLIEIFEIVDPEKNNLFRNLETKEEEQQ